MDIRFEVISKQDAFLNPAFMVPQVVKSSEADGYVYYAALADGRLAGIVVCDPKRFEPEILSIGVSPAFEGRGIATALLEYSVYDLLKEYDEADLTSENRFVARLLGKAGELGAVRSVFAKAGFSAESEGAFYEVEVAALEDNKYLIRNTGRTGAGGAVICPLAKTERSLIGNFAKELTEKGLLEELTVNRLDPDVSMFGVRDGKIVSCFLFAKQSQGVVQNYFLYNGDKKGATADKDLLRLMSESTLAAMEKYPSDARLSFWIGNDTTRSLFERIFPKAEAVEEAVDLELHFSDMAADPEGRFTDDLSLSLLDISKMVCEGCRHCDGSVLSCDKYLQKPDRVLDGGECSLREENGAKR